MKAALEELLSDSFLEAAVNFSTPLLDELKINGVKLELEAVSSNTNAHFVEAEGVVSNSADRAAKVLEGLQKSFQDH
eukprot:1658220-Pyramimonas_sp.AAC.1